MAGSYVIESLTDEIEAQAKAYIEKIDAIGGAMQAINQGYMQQEIQEAAYRTQRAIEKGEEVVVGVNDFLAKLRTRRDNEQVMALLAQLETAAKGTTPLMPLMVECAEAKITLGEICGVLRDVWGQYRPPTFI